MSAFYCLKSTIYQLWSTGHCAVYFLPLTFFCPLSTVYRLPSTIYRLQSNVYSLFFIITVYRLMMIFESGISSPLSSMKGIWPLLLNFIENMFSYLGKKER